MRAIRSFETSETTHPTTQDHHIPETFSNTAVRTPNLARRLTFALHKRKFSWMVAVTGDDCTWSLVVLYFLLLGNMLDDSDIAQILGRGASASVVTVPEQHAMKVCRGRECRIPRMLHFNTCGHLHAQAPEQLLLIGEEPACAAEPVWKVAERNPCTFLESNSGHPAGGNL
jgi:hypothetical protein